MHVARVGFARGRAFVADLNQVKGDDGVFLPACTLRIPRDPFDERLVVPPLPRDAGKIVAEEGIVAQPW